MKTFSIAIYPGDGIGKEVTEQTLRLLETIERRIGGFKLAAARLEICPIFRGCPQGLALGQEKISGIAALDVDHIAHLAQRADLFQ